VKDIALLSATVVAFAVLVTTHCTIVYGLAGRAPRWRALAALFVFPLAPLWGLREGMRFRCATWVGALVIYLGAVLIQRV
jgi:hypothetical protein